MRTLIYSTICLTMAFTFTSANAAVEYRPLKEGPIHEAYVTPIPSRVLLDALADTPPDPILERIPPKVDRDSVWVSGYWAWSESEDDFVWVSGAWRRPPPNHEWIEGMWKKYDAGWVWIPGFWSAKKESALTLLQDSPPDPIDENVGFPQDSNYFWNPGYWEHNQETNDYAWVSGQWVRFDENWVLIPAHYVWRPVGYVFVPAYWDYPLDKRGQLYSSIAIDPLYRIGFNYVPEPIIDPGFLIQYLFVCYPDYLPVCWHHYHFYPDFWMEYCCLPPWWVWDTWWCFTWHDHWALWWWYCHPGFVNPFWLGAYLTSIIAPPEEALLGLIENLIGPPIITPNGVVEPEALLKAIAKTGKVPPKQVIPILPSDPKQYGEILDTVEPLPVDPRVILRPTGRKIPPRLRDRVRVPKPVVTPDEPPVGQRKPSEVPPKPPTRDEIGKPPIRQSETPGSGSSKVPPPPPPPPVEPYVPPTSSPHDDYSPSLPRQRGRQTTPRLPDPQRWRQPQEQQYPRTPPQGRFRPYPDQRGGRMPDSSSWEYNPQQTQPSRPSRPRQTQPQGEIPRTYQPNMQRQQYQPRVQQQRSPQFYPQSQGGSRGRGSNTQSMDMPY